MPGNILCVTSNFPRWDGDSTTPFVLHLAQDLQNLGWGITVLAPHAPGCALRESLEGVKVERFRYLWPEFTETICYQGGALINLRNNRSNYAKLPALVISEFLNIIHRLKSESFDLLHTHWLLPQGFTGVLASSFVQLPHITTVHGGDVFSLNGRLFNKFKQYTLKNVDYITVNSSATLQAVKKISPGLKYVTKIPMGVSFSAANTLDEALTIKRQIQRGKGPILIYVGRLVEEKGVEDVIDAMALLLPDFPEIQLFLVGEGQDRKHFQKKIESLSLGEHIHLTGWIEPEKIPSWLSAADVFIGPSRTAKNGWQEAQGLTFLEAMSVKIPVISTRTGGISDIVKHEITGLIVEQQRPDQIAFSVKRIMGNSILRQHISDRGYRLSMEFSRESSAKSFSNLFSEVLYAKNNKGHS